MSSVGAGPVWQAAGMECAASARRGVRRWGMLCKNPGKTCMWEGALGQRKDKSRQILSLLCRLNREALMTAWMEWRWGWGAKEDV